MLSLWTWLVGHKGFIEGFVGGAVVVGVPALLTLRGQQEARRLADEKNRLELKAQRKQFCVPLLISIHELAPVMAELRKAHDDLWARQELIFQADSYLKRVNPLFKTVHERAAVAGSELSIDPAGQKVMDAYVAYLKAQDEYVQAMIQPLRKLHTRFFGKADISVLDELAKKADDKLTALEEAVRIYVDLPLGAGQPSQNGQSGTSSPARWISQIVQRRPGGPGQGQVKP
jgi:hypothetical protein